MDITTSSSMSLPAGYRVVGRYGRVTADGTDILTAMEALITKTQQEVPDANWLLGITYAEIQGEECSATGYAYALEKEAEEVGD